MKLREKNLRLMKNVSFFIVSLYLIISVSGSLWAVGEKTIALGGADGWNSAAVRNGIVEAAMIRANPVLVLAAGDGVVFNTRPSVPTASALDLSLSFDEASPVLFRDAAGHYKVNTSPALEAADRRLARNGSGAAFFPGGQSSSFGEPLQIEVQSKNALFAPDSRIRDFSLEFWLYPITMENGEEILSWISSHSRTGRSAKDHTYQRILCVAAKNRLQWSFLDFFSSPDGAQFMDINFSGDSPVVPKTWSHHLVRFDSATGMIEYIVDGRAQTIVYANLQGREGGEVYSPIVGRGGILSLGSRYTGLMDEFKIHGSCLEEAALQKYPHSGRMETKTIDLGDDNSEVLRLDVRGGRTSIPAARGSGEFQENGRFRFDNDSEMQFFVRSAENPYFWDNSPWQTFTPGMELTGNVRGRYIQVAANFYPSADGETSPYLEEINITYMSGEPPLPPSMLIAVAQDGKVQLRWKSSPNVDTSGYLVYYGRIKGEYFGEEAIMGSSPIDVGKQNSFVVDGLVNGVLYYFRVAAYNSASHAGEFSREVTARPLDGL